MSGFFKRLQHRNWQYQPLKENESSDTIFDGGSRHSSRNEGSRLLRMLLIGGSLAISFVLGGQWSKHQSRPESCQPNIDLPLHPHVFTYNTTYGSAPSPASNNAWSSLFPAQGGFFRHPEIAPQRSAFATFHQLHCLDAIRQGYWKLVDQTATNDTEPFNAYDDLPFMTSPPHVSHCIDLIRNALICRPDTTIEVKDEEVGGVTGFGTEHQCVDWNLFVGWVSNWETYLQEPKNDTKGEISAGSVHTEHVHHGHDHGGT